MYLKRSGPGRIHHSVPGKGIGQHHLRVVHPAEANKTFLLLKPVCWVFIDLKTDDLGWPRNGYFVISRNTKLDEIKFKFREISRNDFAENSRDTFNIWQNFVVLLVSRKKFREILSNNYFAKWFCPNFAEFCETLLVFREISPRF